MKFSTRARYGLRMMLELARKLRNENLVDLGRIAKVTGISENYLAQLAMTLKNDGLLIGVSGKKGGYQLGRPANEIKISEIVTALIGPISVTECTSNPNLCLTSSYCETRTIWALVNSRIEETLSEFTLADLLDNNFMKNMQSKYSNVSYMFPDKIMAEIEENVTPGMQVPVEKENL
ncbi:MAG: Rrf2 family transcriptional regulator [bacterium]